MHVDQNGRIQCAIRMSISTSQKAKPKRNEVDLARRQQLTTILPPVSSSRSIRTGHTSTPTMARPPADPAISSLLRCQPHQRCQRSRDLAQAVACHPVIPGQRHASQSVRRHKLAPLSGFVQPSAQEREYPTLSTGRRFRLTASHAFGSPGFLHAARRGGGTLPKIHLWQTAECAMRKRSEDGR